VSRKRLPPPQERNGLSRYENAATQPFVEQPIFGNPRVLTQGWYPAIPTRKLRVGDVQSFTLLSQRLVLFRGNDGKVRALDAFCPHMGADLANGDVQGNELRCYFHRWQFTGEGDLSDVPCKKTLPKGVKLNSYPVEEKYGFIWIFGGEKATHPVAKPPGFLADVPLQSLHLRRGTLFAHHHIMMANGIDLQHFASVHGLDIAFDFQVQENSKDVFDWVLTGKVPSSGIKNRLFRWISGDEFTYRVRFAGGTVAAITYGDGRSFGKTSRIPLPSFHILWGCRPTSRLVSEVEIFLVQQKYRGLFGPIKQGLSWLGTLMLLTLLKDEDIKAFPHMRFQAGRLIEADASVARLIQLTNRLTLSPWSVKSIPSVDAGAEIIFSASPSPNFPSETSYAHPQSHA